MRFTATGVSDSNIHKLLPAVEYRAGYNAAMAAALEIVVDVPVMVV